MTDNENDLESERVTHDEQDSHAESWQEELPPEDDFHDHDEQEQSFSDSPELAEESLEEPAPAKKSGTAVMIGTLVVMAIFIGGIAYLQFSKGETAKSAAPVPTDIMTAGKEKPEPYNDYNQKKPATSETGFSDLPVTPTTSEADIEAIYNTGLSNTTTSKTQAVALPGESAPDRAADKAATGKTTSSAIVTTTPSQSHNVGAAPQLQGSKAAPSDPTGTVAPALQPLPPPSLPMVSQEIIPSEMDARLKALSAQLDELRKMVQQTAQETSQLAAHVGTSQETSSTASITVLENRLNQIEKKLAMTETARTTEQVKTVETPSKAATPEMTELKSLLNVEEVTETPVVKKAAPQAKKPKAKSTRVASPAKSKKAKAEPWVLRAATPEAAWVSRGKAEELQQVQVGDTLPGIGKIRSIEQTGDSWMVVGTSGSIR